MPFLRYPALLTFCVAAVCGVTFAAQKPTDAEKKFEKTVNDHIGRLWYASMNAHFKQLSPGTVRIHFVLSKEGKILELHVVSNTSNELAATLTLDAIQRAKIPPVPAELLTHSAYREHYLTGLHSGYREVYWTGPVVGGALAVDPAFKIYAH